MTTMQTAFIEAGVQPIPRVKRVWTWLHDRKTSGATAKGIAAALKDTTQNIQSTLYELQLRKMVRKQHTLEQGSHVFRWFAEGGPEYELLPRHSKAKAKTVTVLPQAGVPVVAKAPAVDIDGMTVAEARALYRQLHAMFGGKT